MSFSKALRREVMNYVATHNPSAYIPYHNNAHLEGVLKISTDLYSSECKVQSVKGLCTLTLAAMFHDFDHSGGTRADSVNIDYAIAGLQEFYHQRSRYLARLRNRHPRLHSGILAAAKNAIACTVYPFTVEPKTLVEKCLRDADILYACLSGDPRVVAEDLRSEMEISQGNPISNAQLPDPVFSTYSKDTVFYRPTIAGHFFYTSAQVKPNGRGGHEWSVEMVVNIQTDTTVLFDLKRVLTKGTWRIQGLAAESFSLTETSKYIVEKISDGEYARLKKQSADLLTQAQ